MLLSVWLLCVGGVAWGTVVGHDWVGMYVGVAVGVGVGMGISLLGLTWNRPTVTIDFFSSDIGESLDLAEMLLVSDTARDMDRVGEDLRTGEDTVFCGLGDVEDAGELVLEGVQELDAELSARSLSCPKGLDWLSASGLFIDPGEELGFVGFGFMGCLISGAVSVLGSLRGTTGGYAVFPPS